MKKPLTTLFIIVFFLFAGYGQTETDSLKIFTFEEYMAIVKDNHPIAKQAELLLQQGKATVLNARGAFDPKAFTDLGQKYFNGSQYYSILNGNLKIPTWLGVDLVAGYEQNRGVFLNPENFMPQSGLVFAGVSVPIGQGLFIDKRRADLQKAKIFREMTNFERQIVLNDLLKDAGKAYWDWFSAYYISLVLEEALELSTIRLNAVKQAAALGDRPNIDTLEASIQVQNIQLNLYQAQLEFVNSTQFLSVFLWLDGTLPLELDEATLPETFSEVEGLGIPEGLLEQLESFLANHPELIQTALKIDQLEVEQKLKKEQLKPVLNLKYNAINEPVGRDPFAGYTINNYTWGFEFGMPLFLRKERGDLQLTKLKIQDSELALENKRANIGFKINAALNEWSTTKNQVDLYTKTVSDFSGLLEGERTLFDLGESSLFVVNARETGYINAQIKLIELVAKNRKAILETNYALGILNQ